MTAFLKWFNGKDHTDQVLKAALAHLWFVTAHPFDDGNGRIARAIADMECNAYYNTLQRTQEGSLDISKWMEWFLACLGRAIDGAQAALSGILAKARFWESVAGISLNERQLLMLHRLVDNDFEGKLTNAKWAKLAKCSHDTALRDLQYLAERGVLIRGSEGGRSTGYLLAMS